MPDPQTTHYRTLMVAENADTEVIGLVYRRLARRFHPDVDPSPEATHRMGEINEAYRVLRHPGLRCAYDADLAARRDRRSTDRLIRRSEDIPVGRAGVPVGPPHGSRLEFGRYSGWTLGQIRRHDPLFLEWLMSVPGGRQYREEISTMLGQRAS